MSEPKPRLVLADGQALFAEGLGKLLEPHFEVVGLAESGEALLDLARESEPDVVVTDVSIPELDGIAVARDLKAERPETKIVILSTRADLDHVRAAFAAGASAYLTKDTVSHEIVTAVREVLRGRYYAAPSVTQYLVEAFTAGEASALLEGEHGPIRVLVVDDNPVVRKITHALLAGVDGIEVVGVAADGAEAVTEARRLEPDVVLMDILMPELDGVEATRILARESSSTRVLVMTGAQVDDKIFAAIQAGAMGYVPKDGDREQYVRAIRQVFRGEPSLPLEITQKLLAAERPPKNQDLSALTEREIEVIRLVAQGLGNLALAERLSISEVTVRTHVRHILDKLLLSNRVELALHALRAGWVSLEEAVEVGE